ncbi:olfactory receptor 5AR1-like [Ambystoma mexicanum]|uniref:olfactory receptor 5AR1-like n=1 Tax=Ambystoma mexicanum TaxID=8296 RepID=UPI0037E98340
MATEYKGLENQTSLTEFVLIGLSSPPQFHMLYFVMFLLIYVFTLLTNLAIVLVIYVDSHLHSPMYFFLMNLSLLDLSFTSVTSPKLLAIFVAERTSISYGGCMAQLYFATSFTSTEFYLLAAMAYDRYVAICNPLRYAAIMDMRVCAMLAAASWVLGFLDTVPPLVLVCRFSFCKSHVINHFFCDLRALVKLSCEDTLRMEVLIYVEGLFIGFLPFLLTLTSYMFIISTITRIRSAEGRWRTFSTCASHLAVVIIFYGTVMCTYMQPTTYNPQYQDKLFSVLYTTFIPLSNPLIYTLRNKDVKRAMRRLMQLKVG